jgi:hypothetical protein
MRTNCYEPEPVGLEGTDAACRMMRSPVTSFYGNGRDTLVAALALMTADQLTALAAVETPKPTFAMPEDMTTARPNLIAAYDCRMLGLDNLGVDTSSEFKKNQHGRTA